MADLIDIKNIAHVVVISNYLKTCNNKSSVDRIVQYYPFFQLLVIDSNETNLIPNLEVLEHFVDNNKFLSNFNNCIEHSLEFVLTNVKCLDGDKIELLEKFLNYFCNLLSRIRYLVRDLNLNVDPERICHLLYNCNKNNVSRKCCIQILRGIFSIPDLIYADSDIFDLCVADCYLKSKMYDVLDLFKLAIAVLSIKPTTPISKSNMLFYWMEVECPKLLPLLSDEVEPLEFLNCLSLVYSTKDENYLKITQAYLPKIDLFEKYLNNHISYETTLTIIVCMLNDLCKLNILPSPCDDLTTYINKSISDKNEILSKDLLLVLNYLKALHTQSKIDKIEILKVIARKCFSCDNISPITLKAILFLYPLCVPEVDRTTSLSNIILSAVSNSIHFDKLLMYRSEELKWFLKSGKYVLKIRALRSWLLNAKNDNVLMSALSSTDDYQLLTEFVLQEHEETISNRAARLLKDLRNKKISIILMRNIPKTLRSLSSFGYLLRAKPAVPEHEKEALFFCTMMSDVLPNLLNIDAFMGACCYSTKLLVQFKDNHKAIEPFLNNKKCILRVHEACTSNCDDSAIYAIRFFALLMKLERRHKIQLLNETDVDFRKILKGSNKRIFHGLILLQLILTSRSLPNLIPPENVLTQYLHVLGIENDEVVPCILDTLTRFMYKFTFVTYSSRTFFMVRRQCDRIKNDESVAKFLVFLEEWLKITHKVEFFKIPISRIKNFLHCHKINYDVSHLLDLLQVEKKFNSFRL